MSTPDLRRKLIDLIGSARADEPTPIDILIVDDSELSRQQIEHAVKQAGIASISVTHAQDGREALSLITKQDFHLMFCDYHMPRMNGQQLIKILHGLKKIEEICVILCTAEHNPKIIEPLMRLGVAGYIRKPIKAETLKSIAGSKSPEAVTT
jgi:CheY-like chemotaxis protein